MTRSELAWAWRGQFFSASKRVPAWLGMLLAALIVLTPAAASAQEAVIDAQALEPMMEKAREDGMTVIIVTPGDEADEEEIEEASMAAMALDLRTEVRRIVSNAPNYVDEALATLRAASPDGTLNWLYFAIAMAIVGIIVGNVPAWYIRRRGREYFRSMYNPEPANNAEKISYLLFRAAMILVNMTILFFVAMAAALIFDTGHDPSRQTIFAIVAGYVAYYVIRYVIYLNMAAPDVPTHRMINLSDEDAKTSYRDWYMILPVIVIVISFSNWMLAIGMSPDAHKLTLIGGMLLAVLLFGIVAVKERVMFGGVILGAGDPTSKPGWRRALASVWHILVLIYLAVAWVVGSIQVLLDGPSPLIIITAPLIAFIVGMGVYGIAIVVIDRFYRSRRRRFDEKVALALAEKAREEAALQQAQNGVGGPTEGEEMVVNAPGGPDKLADQPVFKPVFKGLFEQAAGIFISIVAVGFLLSTWDVNVGERGNPITAFMDILMVVFVAWFLYRAVVVFVNAQLEEQGIEAEATPGEPGEEMSGQGASRLATLLPLIRIVLVTTIFAMAGMIILSSLGVDIAPLFAGAGVVGLAVGFGAQTLIRDIFSGGFFLADDAFRRGEYIELGDIRGTVEKISLRSFQLRHHNGPLHTIPFGEITQLTNYSRDWVMMKLPLRVTYDTDVEKVRKLVKKLGQSLLEREDVGDNFLQPLKSQGVYKMEDSAMIIRVKFMTKPGDQFVTRKVVYAAIRELFEREGIKFAHKEVTVRLAEEPEKPLTDAEKKAVTAAARSAIDADEEAAAGAATVDDGP